MYQLHRDKLPEMLYNSLVNRVGKNYDFFEKNKKNRIFFYVNQIFLI